MITQEKFEEYVANQIANKKYQINVRIFAEWFGIIVYMTPTIFFLMYDISTGFSGNRYNLLYWWGGVISVLLLAICEYDRRSLLKEIEKLKVLKIEDVKLIESTKITHD